MKKILVIGSTGMLGKPVTRELYRAGFDITLLARDIAKTRKAFPNGRILEGDVLTKKSLAEAMKGQQELYVNLNTPQTARQEDVLPEREGIDNIIEAAKATGIKRISFLSSLVKNYNGTNGFHWWVFDMKQSAVDKIKNSGIPYTIYYASSFMENLDHLMLKSNKIMLAGRSRAPMWFIAGEDFGRQVAWAIAKTGQGNKEYAVQGLESYTWDEAAKIFKEHYTREHLRIVKTPLTVIQLLGKLRRDMSYVYMIMKALNNYYEKFESANTWEELGKPLITLKAYAEQRSKKGG
jgi:nucleoside-diphosphate-sugar epimerase